LAQVAERAADPELGGRFGLDARLTVVALGFQARALTDLGQFEAAERAAEGCAKLAAELALPFESIFAALAEGYLLLGRGAATEAITPLAQALALCERAEADLMRPVAQSFLGAAEAASGSISEGLANLEFAVKAAAEMGLLFQQPLRMALLSEALSAADRKHEGAERAAEALDLALSQGDQASLAIARRAAVRANQ